MPQHHRDRPAREALRALRANASAASGRQDPERSPPAAHRAPPTPADSARAGSGSSESDRPRSDWPNAPAPGAARFRQHRRSDPDEPGAQATDSERLVAQGAALSQATYRLV